MNRLFYLSCLVLCLGPSLVFAQRSQEANADFGIPIVGRAASIEPDLALGKKLMIEQTNAFRQEHGEQPVRLNPDLEAAASSFAHYMASSGKYGHTADGHEPWDRARLAGYDYCLIDENIAYAFDPASFTTERLVEVFVRGWEHSPEHRKNLLDPDIVDIGVAISYDAKSGKYYAVQDFGRPKAMAYRFTISNDTDDEISYRVDSKDFKLTPHYRMVHARCRPSAVAVTLTGTDGKEHVETLRPTSGQNLTIRKNGSNSPVVVPEQAILETVIMRKTDPFENRPEQRDRPPTIDPRLEVLAQWMDSAFHVPILGTRFGLDALIGLIPGVGDTVTSLVSLYILNAARQHGVPRVTLMRMAVNVAVDYLLGAVPLLGDVFDVYWKANQRNVNLLRQHLQTSPAQERRSRIADGLFMVALVLVLIAILIGSLTLAYFIVTRLAELITHR